MLIKQSTLDQIAAGKISLAFRSWKRPSVRSGGTLRTAIGMLSITAVEVITESEITDRDARKAGFASRAELLSELRKHRPGQIYRVALRPGPADPRIALRAQSRLSDAEREQITHRLAQLDERSVCGPWTTAVLNAIAKSPGLRAADLGKSCGFEKEWLKTQVTKLKALGLTISLSPGYQLSPRGAAYRRFQQKNR